MNKYDITKKIELFAPIETAENWDCVGFMAETDKEEISKIMLCLTPTDDTISQAINQNCDMLIAHHPMFYINCNTEAFPDFSPSIDIYSAHTNLDKAKGGTTDTIIKTLGLENFQIPTEHDFIRIVELEKEIYLTDFSARLSKISPNGRIINNKGAQTVKKIAFCAGSGSEFIKESENLGVQCLVTGDLKFHTALDSNIVVYDIGHFESEILILPVLKNIIGDSVDVVFAKEKSPFEGI